MGNILTVDIMEYNILQFVNQSINKTTTFRTIVTKHANALHQIHCQLNRIIRWLLGCVIPISLRLVEQVTVGQLRVGQQRLPPMRTTSVLSQTTVELCILLIVNYV